MRSLCNAPKGGGFHHCSANAGGGFCAYADITLAVKVYSYTTILPICSKCTLKRNHLLFNPSNLSVQFMFNHIDGIRKAMIVDFDAHQVCLFVCVCTNTSLE